MSKATAQSAEDPILQWVTFRLDNESYAIDRQLPPLAAVFERLGE